MPARGRAWESLIDFTQRAAEGCLGVVDRDRRIVRKRVQGHRTLACLQPAQICFRLLGIELDDLFGTVLGKLGFVVGVQPVQLALWPVVPARLRVSP
jgi:hypothetical protein